MKIGGYFDTELPVYANGDEIKDGRSATCHVHGDVDVAYERWQSPRAVYL
jgi:hypothetical protein